MTEREYTEAFRIASLGINKNRIEQEGIREIMEAELFYIRIRTLSEYDLQELMEWLVNGI